PTPWTQRSLADFRNTSRSLCRVALSLGTGSGGLLMTWRYDVAAGREEEQRKKLAHEVLPALADRPGVVGVHLCLADRAGSSLETTEKKVRKEPTLIPNWVLLVEGGSEAELLEAACRESLADAMLLGAGAVAPIERCLYQLQYTRLKTPGT